MPIQELARDDVVSASPETPVTDVARTLRDEDVGSIVITAEDRPVGIITDRDLTTRVVAAGVAPAGQTAEDVMSTDLCVVESGAGFYEAARVMCENGVRRLPVLGDEGDLAGIVTVDDLNELLADEHQQLSEVIRAQRPPY